MNKMKTILLGLFCLLSIISKAQPGKIIDKVIAMVDNNIILHSDIENQMELLGYKPEEREEGRCQLLDQMLVNKLLVAQAILLTVFGCALKATAHPPKTTVSFGMKKNNLPPRLTQRC